MTIMQKEKHNNSSFTFFNSLSRKMIPTSCKTLKYAIQSMPLLVIIGYLILKINTIPTDESNVESFSKIPDSLLRNVSYVLDTYDSCGEFSLRNSLNAPSLMFYKTHKTCSSTVTGILWRLLCYTSCGSSSNAGKESFSHFSRGRYENCFVPPASTPGRTWDFNRGDHTRQIQSSIGTAHRGPPFTVWIHHAKGKRNYYCYYSMLHI